MRTIETGTLTVKVDGRPYATCNTAHRAALAYLQANDPDGTLVIRMVETNGGWGFMLIDSAPAGPAIVIDPADDDAIPDVKRPATVDETLAAEAEAEAKRAKGRERYAARKRSALARIVATVKAESETAVAVAEPARTVPRGWDVIEPHDDDADGPADAKMSGNAVRILRTYHAATPEEMAEGMTWYRTAAQEIRRRLVPLGVTFRQACGIVAALSPQTPWARNILYAERCCRGENTPATGDRRRLAESIRDGADPVKVVKGLKTGEFLACLLDQRTDRVCIDGHAYSIWVGRRIETSKVPTLRASDHAIIREDYQSAAYAAGVRPHQMQAITWLAWRRLHAVRRDRPQ
jgi:hypothetical protein